MKSSRTFCRVCLCFVAFLLLFNGVVWHLATRQLLTRQHGVVVGDLARMGYLPRHVHERASEIDLPRRHLDPPDLQGGQVDMVTLGDSFSNGLGLGKNRFYQDYIATFNDMTVLNLQPYEGAKNYLESVAILLNSGYLDELKPKYVLLEMVERSCLSRLGREVDLSASDTLDKVKSFYANGGAVFRGDGALPPVGFFNTGNLKFVLFQLGYLFSDHAFASQVYKLPLVRPMFSGPKGDEILFLDKDVRKLKYDTEENARNINDNLNRLARLLKDRGIELYFMPPPNKYTLYRPYLVDNSYPQSRFFERLRPLSKEYHFIDAKQILARQLEQGEEDIYFIDDTHWSWKASEAIFREVRFR